MSAVNGQSLPEDAEATASAPILPRTLNRHVRHDMRTQLNQIIGYSDLLIDEVTERALHDLAPDLQKIHAAGLRLLELINQHVDPVTRRADNTPPGEGQIDDNEPVL